MTRLKNELIGRLEQTPGVTHRPWPDRHDGFSTILVHGKEVGHFHHFNELDLRLGKERIATQGLKHNPNSDKHPKRKSGSQYIELPFHKRSDLDDIVALVQLLAEA